MTATILVIEDEPAIGETVRYALESEGFVVLLVRTGGEGLEALERERVALAVLDIGLPDMNGLELFRRIRANDSVPVLFLTARGSEVDRIVGLELGADDYMVKPFSPRELSARVKAILRRTGGAAGGHEPPVAKGLPFVIDRERHRVLYFGVPLVLTRLEFRVLEQLVARPGHVFSRDMLMEHGWDDPAASMDRTVDSHIKSIRARLREIAPEVEAIITHRGIGYSLREDW
ncbi:MAG: two-component system response regulator CreB [Bdellovibrionales bacterium]|nr:two-component system response regulator CreB [Bdellovibrionales bacterium]